LHLAAGAAGCFVAHVIGSAARSVSSLSLPQR
jgi:hypothetical protein